MGRLWQGSSLCLRSNTESFQGGALLNMTHRSNELAVYSMQGCQYDLLQSQVP